MGGMSMTIEGQEDAGTGGEEGVCLWRRRKKEAKVRHARRKKTVTPDAGQKYGDCYGGGGAAVRQETTTLSVCRSSSHTWVHVYVCANAQILHNAQKTTTSVPYHCSALDNIALFPIMTTGFVLGSFERLASVCWSEYRQNIFRRPSQRDRKCAF